MEGPPLGPGGEDITMPDQVAPRGRKVSTTRKIQPQTSNLIPHLHRRRHRSHHPICHLQHPHHHRHIRPRYVTPPTARDSTLTIDATGKTTARYVTSSTLAITNQTTTLTISITDTTRGTNTTGDSDRDNSDRLTHGPHHQLTRCLHRPHLHYRLYRPHQRHRQRRNHPLHHPHHPHHQHHQHPPQRHLRRPRHLPAAHTEETPEHPLNLTRRPHDRDPAPRGTRANRRNTPHHPKGQSSRGTEQQSEHANTRTRRPPYRTPPCNTAATPSPRFPQQEVRCSPLPVGRRLPRPPGHPTPTGSQRSAPTRPPANHGTAAARPPHEPPLHIPRSHRRPERGTPAKRTRPSHHAPAPPPPKDIYAKLAGTLAHPMDAEQYYHSVQRELPADSITLQGWRQEEGNDNEWGTEDDLLCKDTWKGTMDTFLEAAAATYPCPPGDTRHGLHTLLAFHSWKHRHTITLHPLDHNPHRWTPEDDATAAIAIQQDPGNPAGYHITWNDPARQPPASPTLQDVLATISAELQEPKAPEQPDDDMPQAPSPPTAQESPRKEPLTHPITTMELPPQHRTTPDRNGMRNLLREWAVHNGTLRWDEIRPGLQAIRLHSITEPTTSWALPTDRHLLLLSVQGDATITPTEGDPITAALTHAVHIPPQPSSAPMTVHPGPTQWQAIVITYPTPNDHTHTWQQRWEHIRGDLLQEHLGLTSTHHTLHPVQGVGQALHGIKTPGLWAYATPINPQAAEEVKTALSIQQAQTQTPHRNTQRGYTIRWAYQDHDTLTPQPGPRPLDTNTTALLQDAAAAATQVGAPESWSPQYLVETKVAHHAKAQEKPPSPKPLQPPLKLDTVEHTPIDEWATH